VPFVRHAEASGTRLGASVDQTESRNTPARMIQQLAGPGALTLLCGFHEGPIPWPVGRTGRDKALVLAWELVEAVKWESE